MSRARQNADHYAGSTSASDLDSGTLAITRMAAGTVLQILQFETTETNALSTTFTNLYENSITLKSASSDIFIYMSFQAWLYAGSGFGWKIYRNNAATVTTSHTAVWTKNVQSAVGDLTETVWQQDQGGTVQSFFAKDSLSGFSIDDELFYGFFARKKDSNIVLLPHDNTEDGFINMLMMEVAK